MPFTLVLRIALRALRRNTLRTVLSMLGISIGVGAFICSVAVGQGASQQIEEQIRSLGENFIWIEAGNRNVNGVRTGTHGTQSLTVRDAYALQAQIPFLAQMSPNVDMRVQVVYRDQNWATQVRGVTPAYVAVRGWRLAVGARQRDIHAQFLVEAVTMALLGGGCGIGLGLGSAYGIAAVAAWRTLIRAETLVVAVGFAVAVGIVFGFYPARQAAHLDPIEALRR